MNRRGGGTGGTCGVIIMRSAGSFVLFLAIGVCSAIVYSKRHFFRGAFFIQMPDLFTCFVFMYMCAFVFGDVIGCYLSPKFCSEVCRSAAYLHIPTFSGAFALSFRALLWCRRWCNGELVVFGERVRCAEPSHHTSRSQVGVKLSPPSSTPLPPNRPCPRPRPLQPKVPLDVCAYACQLLGASLFVASRVGSPGKWAALASVVPEEGIDGLLECLRVVPARAKAARALFYAAKAPLAGGTGGELVESRGGVPVRRGGVVFRPVLACLLACLLALHKGEWVVSWCVVMERRLFFVRGK